MGRGAWLPSVHFDANLRKELLSYLRSRDAPAIIADLEEVVQTLPVFRRTPRRRALGSTLQELKASAAQLRKQLAELVDDEDAEDLIIDALALLRWDPVKFRASLIEALDVLDNAIDRVQEMRRRGGGRPRDLEATWLVDQVADTLKRHGVKVTSHEDRVCAQIIRALWPYALPNREAPLELKPWFKLLKSQR